MNFRKSAKAKSKSEKKLSIELKENENKLDYFDVSLYRDTYPEIRLFAFITPRSIGKTYSAIKLMVDEWEEQGRGTLFMFRTFEETKSFKSELKANLDQERYLIVGNAIIDKETKIECFKLSSITRGDKEKNNDYIKNIIFDEFIPRKPYFISEEYEQFIHLVKTMNRNKKDFRVYMLANPNRWNNVYFSRWGLFYDPNNLSVQMGSKAIFFIKDGEYLKNQSEDTISDELIKDDEQYFKMSVKGDFSYSNFDMVYDGKEVETIDYLFHISLNEKTYTLRKITDNKIFMSDKIDLDIPTKALTTIDALINSNANKQDLEDFAEMIKLHILNNKIVFETIDMKIEMITYINRFNLLKSDII